MDAPLSTAEKRILLQIARKTLIATTSQDQLPPLEFDTLPSRLTGPGSSFVTLTMSGELRGCVGSLERRSPLAKDVQDHTAAAAREDHRFQPILSDEVDQIEIEIAVLSILQKLEYKDGDDLSKKIQSGVEGVMITSGSRRATFLPKVWVKVRDTEQFLDLLCEKACLPREVWRSGELSVFVYRADSFDETLFTKTKPSTPKPL